MNYFEVFWKKKHCKTKKLSEGLILVQNFDENLIAINQIGSLSVMTVKLEGYLQIYGYCSYYLQPSLI